jgi:hypothetical protein
MKGRQAYLQQRLEQIKQELREIKLGGDMPSTSGWRACRAEAKTA